MRVLATGRVATREPAARSTAAEIYPLLRARARAAVDVLVSEGPATVIGKASHLLRRQRSAPGAMYVSFAGRVIEDRSERGLTPGVRVAGLVLTHPEADVVVARPEYVFELPEGVGDEAAALVLPGGLAVRAAEQALGLTDGPVGVSGPG
ncbi:MAG: hypothetical protein M3340_02225, partial [Actinomycetota bacterium]|nr:hypothetical protein [Actinomycetota bacterium]